MSGPLQSCNIKRSVDFLEEGRPVKEEPQTKVGTPFVVVVMRAADLQGEAGLRDFARRFHPRYFYDMRIAPRLDQLAGSRLRAFQLFEELNVEYQDLFGRAGVSNISDVYDVSSVLSQMFTKVLAARCDKQGAAVFFFDNEDLMKISIELLPTTIDSTACAPTVSEYKSGLLSMLFSKVAPTRQIRLS